MGHPVDRLRGRRQVALGNRCRSLLDIEQYVDPLVHCIEGDDAVDVAGTSLGDPMDPILGLLVVVETERSIVVDHVGGLRESQPLLARRRGGDQ